MMRQSFLTGIFLVLGASLHAQTVLPIRSVLMYPDRAQITRKDQVKLAAGKNRIIVGNVSPNLSPDTLRAACAPDCTIVEISSRLDRFAEAVRPRIQALEKKLAAVQEKRDSVAQAVSRNAFVLTFTNQLGAAAGRVIGEETIRPGESSRWRNAFTFIQNEKSARKKVIQKLEDDLRRVDLELQAVQRELNQAKSDGEKTARTIEVRINALRATTAELQISYNITGASWSISYGATLQKDGGVTLEMFGDAIQSTGEDWKNVSLGFSTANTQRGIDRPKLRAFRLRVNEMRVQQVYKLDERGAGNEIADAEPASEAETGGVTQIETGGTALVFRVPEAQTVDSSNRPQKIPLAKFNLKPVESYFRVVPSISTSAVFAVKLKNDRVFPLLAGPVDLFRAGRFTGKTRLAYVPGSSEFTLGFAEDRNIMVNRNVIRNRGNASIIGDNKLLTREIRFEAENRGKESAEVRIYETVPVSELQEVVVTVTQTGGFKEEKAGSGIYSQRFTLAPGAKVSASLTYTVKAPPDFPEHMIDR
ncbi:MAG: mucoidy inhibitor MuiA family protein [Leptospirales bacterium]|nr:mucoidy inhibitor MuiA family protein [Leptospirales bacterium]